MFIFVGAFVLLAEGFLVVVKIPRMETRLTNKTTEKWPFIRILQQSTIGFEFWGVLLNK